MPSSPPIAQAIASSAFVKRRRENRLILQVSPACASPAASFRIFCVSVGIEWFPLFDADGLELIDHDFVAFQPWFSLHEAVERLKETQIVGDGAVERDVINVHELCRRRMGGLRERIDLDPLAVCDGFSDIGVAATLEGRTQDSKTRVSR